MKEKNSLIEKPRNPGFCRRNFFSRKPGFGKTLGIGLLALQLGLVGLSGCKKLTSSEVAGIGDSSLTVEITGFERTDQDGNPIIRANTTDTLQVTATARGLSSRIGFFLAGRFGTLQGGTLDTTDGFTYFDADEDGRARALIVALNSVSSTQPGRGEIWVKSQHKTVIKKVTFEFATLTIFPSTVVFDGENSTVVSVVARGGLPPIEWFISNPRAVALIHVDDFTVKLMVADWNALQGASPPLGTGVTLTALDAEGQVATAIVKAGTSTCTTGILSVDPNAGTAGTPVTVSVTLDDFDRQRASSVDVQVTGEGVSAVVTLTPWMAPGLFQGLFSFTPSSAGIYSFSTPDTTGTCQGEVVVATFTAG